MRRYLHLILSFAVAFSCLAPVADAPAAAQSASDTPTPAIAHGSYLVTLHMAIVNPMPNHSTYLCRASAVPSPTVLPGESVTAMAVVSGNVATCVLHMPLAWIPLSTPTGSHPAPALRFSIAAYPAPDTALGNAAEPLRNIAVPAIAVDLPQPDGERALDLPLAF